MTSIRWLIILVLVGALFLARLSPVGDRAWVLATGFLAGIAWHLTVDLRRVNEENADHKSNLARLTKMRQQP